MSFEDEINQITREIMSKLSDIDLRKPVEKVRDILEESKKEGKIIDFLFLDNYQKYGDFIIIMIKNNRYIFSGLTLNKENKFTNSLMILVDSQTDKQLKKEWQKILQEFKES